MSVTQKVTLYNNKFTVPPVINAVQNDTDRQVEAYFGDFTLQAGMTGKLSFIRSDGTHYEVSATLNTGANTATAELDQALTQAGVTQAQLKITDSGNVGSTFTFMIKVQPDVAGISVPQDGWSAQEFDQRLTDAENAIDAVEEDVADLQDKEYDYAPVITDTASGSIATFPDGADSYPLKECVVDVDAVQDLHGYDNPWPAGGGKNLLDADGMTAGILNPSGQVEMQNVTVNSKGNGAVDWTSTGTWRGVTTDFIAVQGGSAYRISLTETISYVLYAWYDQSKGFISRSSFSGSSMQSVTAPNNAYYVRFTFQESVAGTYSYTKMQLESGSSATSYAPYSNLCPITGWSSAKVPRCGKNFFSVPSIELGGTNARTVNINVDQIPTGQYYFSSVRSGTVTSNYGIQFIGNNGLVAQVSTNTQSINVTEPIIRIYAYMSSADYNDGKTLSLSDIQLERGSSASEYEEYVGQTFTIDLDGTRYDGTLDVTRGKLTVTHRYALLNDPTKWVESSGTTNVYYTDEFSDRKKYSDSYTGVICSYIKVASNDMYNAGRWLGATDNRFGIRSEAVTLESVQADATANKIAILYELATPIEVDLTPTEITTLLGTNNLWSDTGDVEVEYCCSTKLFIEKKLAELA